MSFYVANVQVLRIKPELREETEHFFRGETSLLTDEILLQFVEEYEEELGEFPGMEGWTHDGAKKEWQGKYRTSYDKETGILTYGIYYNLHGCMRFLMFDFDDDIVPYLAEEVLFSDGWAEE